MRANYLKKKPEDIVARSYYNLKTSRTIGGFMSVFGILIFIVPFLMTNGNENQEVTPILMISVLFIIGGLTFLAPHYVYKSRPIKNYVYRPIRIGLWNLISSLFGLSFIYYFLFIFYYLGALDKEEYIGYLMLFFLGIFTIVFGIRIVKAILKIIKGILTGRTELIVDSKSYYSKGETITGKIINPRIKSQQLNITLRNLEESYSGDKNKNASSNSYITKIHAVETTVTEMNTRSEFVFEIRIPEQGFASIESVHNPTYWELDCRGTETSFRALFRIGVA